MSDENGKTAAEQAVEVLVYAPIGLLFEGSSLVPQLVEKGRNQVTMARMIGKFAIQQGRTEALRTAGKLGDQAAGLLDFLGDTLAPAPAEPPPAPRAPGHAGAKRRPASSGRAMAAAKTSAKPSAAAAEPTAARRKPRTAATKPTTAANAPVSGAGAGDVVVASSLAITDYDGLSASHVVNRLGGLLPEELEAVRRYEAANRGRKTILSKIAQLQSH